MRIAVLLLALIGVAHYAPDWIATAYEQQDAAARAWFYMLRGVEGVALFALVAALSKHIAVIAVCVLGMFEEGMTTACRASKPIGGFLGYEPFSGLCGKEWYWLGLGLLGLLALGLAYELGRGRGKKRT